MNPWISFFIQSLSGSNIHILLNSQKEFGSFPSFYALGQFKKHQDHLKLPVKTSGLGLFSFLVVVLVRELFYNFLFFFEN